MLCLHCKRCKPFSRGLCRGCWNDRTIREQYPQIWLTRPDEPTEADLDRLIAEQRAKAPKWFLWEEYRRDHERRGPYTFRFRGRLERGRKPLS